MEKFVATDYPNEFPEIEVDMNYDDDNNKTYSYRIREHFFYVKKEDDPYQKWYRRVLVMHKASGFKSIDDAFDDAITFIENRDAERRGCE